jgi:AcrR family transcriptional regulator
MVMMTVGFRARVRRTLQDDVLDVVRETIIKRGWQALRMSGLAAAVGVSRQTLYTEFGTKDALAEALAVREAQRFLRDISAELAAGDGELGDAVAVAVTRLLRAGAEDPLLHAVFTGGYGGETSLLPMLTTRAEPIYRAAQDVMVAYVAERHSELDSEEVMDLLDVVIRMVVSHLLLPLEPVEVVARRLAWVAECTLGRAKVLTAPCPSLAGTEEVAMN